MQQKRKQHDTQGGNKVSELNNLAIKMDRITKTFGKVVANKNVNLELREGEILALLGENGCGKITFCIVYLFCDR